MSRISVAGLGLLVLGLVAWWPLAAGEKLPGLEIVQKLVGHSEPVYTVAFSPDGKLVATGSFDHTVKLWDVATGKEIKTYAGTTGHQKMISSLAFSLDGRSIASGSADNALKVWDVPVDTPLRTLKVPGEVQAVALSPDGTKLAYASAAGVIQIVGAADFKELAKCEGHQGAVEALAFNANGQLLASIGADRTVRFWNLKGELQATAGAHAGTPRGIAINAAGLAQTVGDDGLLKLWQVPGAPVTKSIALAGPVRAFAASADGTQFVTGGDDKLVRHFTLAAGKETRSFPGAEAPIAAVALGANNLIAAGTQDRRVHVWAGADGKVLGQWLAHAGPVQAVHVMPAGTQLLTAGGDGLAKIWALPAVATRVLTHPDAVVAAVASPDGKKLYTGSTDGIVRVWDTTKPAIERQFAGHVGEVRAVSVNGPVLASGGADGTLRFWNPTSGKESDIVHGHTKPVTALALGTTSFLSAAEDGAVKVWQLPLVGPKTLPHPGEVTCALVSADGAKLVTGGNDKQVRLWNVATGAKERDFAGPTLGIAAVALSGNGATIAAASADKTVTLWAVADAKVLHKIALPANPQALAFSPDNQSILAGLADGSVRLFAIADGKETKNLVGHKGAVVGLAFAPDGKLLYSGGADQAVQTWAWPEGVAKASLKHAGPITAISLSRDGKRVAAAANRAVKIWETADGKEIASWNAPGDVQGVALAPDGRKLALAHADKLARIYDIDGKLAEAFPHEGPVFATAFVDAKKLVTASADKLARIWTSSLLWQGHHTGPVRTAIFGPRGELVLSAGDDKTVRFWNAADGKEAAPPAATDVPVTQLGLPADGLKLFGAAGPQILAWTLNAKPGTPTDPKPAVTPAGGPIHALAVSPNGQRVAVATEDQGRELVRIIDPALGREVQAFAELTGPARCLAFLADNRTLVAGSSDKNARLLDVNLATALAAHPPGVTLTLPSNVATQILSAGADKTVKLWDLTKGAALKQFGPVAEPITAIAFSRDYTLVGAAAGKSVKVWALADGKEIATLVHPAEVRSLAFNQEKTRLATGSVDKQARLWDLATGKEVQFFPEDDIVSDVTFAGPNLISAAGKTVRLEAPTGLRSVAVGAPVNALANSADGSLTLTGSADGKAKLWNLTSLELVRSFDGAGGPIRGVAISKNGQLVAVGGDDQTVRVYQFADGKEVGTLKVGAAVRSVAFSPNSAILLATAADKSIRAWSTAIVAGQPPPVDFLQPAQSFAGAGLVADLAVAPDNATFYSAGREGAVHTWKLAATAPTRTFGHPNLVDAVAFQPAGELLASGGHDGKVRLYELLKNTQVKEIAAHVVPPNSDPVYNVVFTADGKQLLSSSYDGSLKLWEVPSGNLIREFKAYKVKEFEKGHRDPVQAAAISADGKFLASGSGGQERLIKIWNLGDGSVVRDLVNPALQVTPTSPPSSQPGAVAALRFTRDGKYLIAIGDAPQNKGYLGVWDWQAGKLIYSETLPLGVFSGLALAPDDRTIAIAAGSRGRPRPDLNAAYLLRIPALGK